MSSAPPHYMIDDLQYSQVHSNNVGIEYDEQAEYDEQDIHGLMKSSSVVPRGRRRGLCRNKLCIVAVVGITAVIVVGVIVGVSVHNQKSQQQEQQQQQSSSLEPPQPPTYLDQLCNPSFMSHHGNEGCIDACAPSACCYLPTNVEGSCMVYEEQCRVYKQSCNILGSPGSSNSGSEEGDRSNGGGAAAFSGDIPTDDGDADDAMVTHIDPAPAEITDHCSQANLDESLEGIRQCARICINASCCYDSDEDTNCSSEQPNCEGYQACYNLSAKLQTDFQDEPDYPPGN